MPCIDDTRLRAFLWFGGNDDDDDADKEREQQLGNNNATVIAANLAAISQVMDTKLGSFKASQRVGDRTGAMLADLAATLVEEGGGTGNKVRVSLTGQQVPVRVQIDEQYLQDLVQTLPPKEAAEELSSSVTAALKAAHAKSGQKLQDKLKSLYQELGF